MCAPLAGMAARVPHGEAAGNRVSWHEARRMPGQNVTNPPEISLVPPQIVADNAAKGLYLRERFRRGGTEIGVGRARELVERRALQPSTIRRMVSFFARHEVDKRARNFANEDNPSAGYVAWLL